MIKSYFDSVTFAYPQLLFLLLLLPLLAGWYISRFNRQQGAVMVSSLRSFQNTRSFKSQLRHLPFVLRLLAIGLLITAMARPQTFNDERKTEGEGVDIVLCMDVSGSMLAQDFRPNRLEVAKQVATDFVRNRPIDRIGIVIFSGESFTQCPITTDHNTLEQQIMQIRSGLLEGGTAIGSGLATSVDRLRTSKAKSKVIILLTDGENNGGLIDPKTAKEIAKSEAIKVYTIGVGSEGYAATPVETRGGQVVLQQEKVNIDEKLLTEIAKETGGVYFRAKQNDNLTAIYKEIDQLEKTKVEVTVTRRYTERFFPLVLIALGLIFIEAVLRFTLFRKFP